MVSWPHRMLPGWPGQAPRLTRPGCRASQARLPSWPGQDAGDARIGLQGSVVVTNWVLSRGGNLRKGEAGNRHSLAAARRTAAMLRGLLLEKLLQRELLLLLRELLLRETVRQHERFIFAAWSPPGGAGGFYTLGLSIFRI